MWEEKSCNAVSDLMIIHYIIIDFWSACGLYRKIKDYAAISILLKWQWCKILLFTIVMWNEAVKSLYGLCLSQLFDYKNIGVIEMSICSRVKYVKSKW